MSGIPYSERPNVKYDGKEWKLSELAKHKGIKRDMLRSRWDRAGKPEIIPESMLAEKSKSTASVFVTILPDGERVNAHCIAKRYGISHNIISYRVRRGKKTFTVDELNELANRTKSLVPRTTNQYKDPNFLPDIPFGDLSHLSNTQNNGNGKGEIPDEEWCNRVFAKPVSSKNNIDTLLNRSASSATVYHKD